MMLLTSSPPDLYEGEPVQWPVTPQGEEPLSGQVGVGASPLHWGHQGLLPLAPPHEGSKPGLPPPLLPGPPPHRAVHHSAGQGVNRVAEVGLVEPTRYC